MIESDIKATSLIDLNQRLNSNQFNSLAFDTIYDEKLHDLMMMFQYEGARSLWKFSIYTTKPEIDCSLIAKSLGGGGHRSASGFQLKDLKEIGLS